MLLVVRLEYKPVHDQQHTLGSARNGTAYSMEISNVVLYKNAIVLVEDGPKIAAGVRRGERNQTFDVSSLGGVVVW